MLDTQQLLRNQFKNNFFYKQNQTQDKLIKSKYKIESKENFNQKSFNKKLWLKPSFNAKLKKKIQEENQIIGNYIRRIIESDLNQLAKKRFEKIQELKRNCSQIRNRINKMNKKEFKQANVNIIKQQNKSIGNRRIHLSLTVKKNLDKNKDIFLKNSLTKISKINYNQKGKIFNKQNKANRKMKEKHNLTQKYEYKTLHTLPNFKQKKILKNQKLRQNRNNQQSKYIFPNNVQQQNICFYQPKKQQQISDPQIFFQNLQNAYQKIINLKNQIDHNLDIKYPIILISEKLYQQFQILKNLYTEQQELEIYGKIKAIQQIQVQIYNYLNIQSLNKKKKRNLDRISKNKLLNDKTQQKIQLQKQEIQKNGQFKSQIKVPKIYAKQNQLKTFQQQYSVQQAFYQNNQILQIPIKYLSKGSLNNFKRCGINNQQKKNEKKYSKILKEQKLNHNLNEGLITQNLIQFLINSKQLHTKKIQKISNIQQYLEINPPQIILDLNSKVSQYKKYLIKQSMLLQYNYFQYKKEDQLKYEQDKILINQILEEMKKSDNNQKFIIEKLDLSSSDLFGSEKQQQSFNFKTNKIQGSLYFTFQKERKSNLIKKQLKQKQQDNLIQKQVGNSGKFKEQYILLSSKKIKG